MNQGPPGAPPGPGINPQAGPPMGGPPQGGPPQGPNPQQMQQMQAMQQAMQAKQQQEQEDQQQEEQENQFDIALQAKNLAESIDDDELKKIAEECFRGYEDDESSRKQWVMATKEWLKLAGQITEKKTYPWPDASNIKFPLISTAAMQFSARAYPSLVPADGNIVQAQIWGNDPDGTKTDKGNRIGKYMSWQLMQDLDYWEEDMDKLLLQVSVVGMMHKKTYYCKVTDKIQSTLVYPENFVVDYWTVNLDDCERVSEILWLSHNKIKEKQLAKEFLDIDLGSAPSPEASQLSPTMKMQKTVDWTTPHKVIEQHTWLDLNKDGLREPYIVWFDHASKKILRIQARYVKDGVKTDDKGKPICYEPLNYYTKFGFIPNPDGSYYDYGFGHLLGPINEGINTILNQLIDAGTLSNMQVGFIGKGLRMKMGTSAFQPGEWKAVNATGDDLRKQIVPLPTKEPSNVLFQLLGQLISSGKELASVAEIFTGKMPGQNTPATTTMATIEQGMKVFTAIYKRIYRSLAKEYKKVFKLNGYYLDKDTYIAILGQDQAQAALNPGDFDDEVYDVCPTADPTATTQTEKLQKAQALMELMQAFGPTAMPMEKVLIRILQAQEQPNWQELVPGMQQTGQPQPVQPPPDPKMMAIQAKAKAEQAKILLEQQAQQQQMQNDQQSHSEELQFKQAEHQMKMQQTAQELQLKGAQAHADMNIQVAKENQQMQHDQQQHQMGLAQQHEAHKATMQQTEEAAKVKNEVAKSTSQSKTSSTGKRTK
jgi:chaperonin GroES